MRYLQRIIFLISLLLSSCNFNSNFSTTVSTPTPTTLETTSKIYSAALSYINDINMGYPSPPVQYCSSGDLALYYMTKSLKFDKRDWEYIHRRMPAIEQDLWDNFLKINLQSISLSENLDIGCKYRLITNDDLVGISSFENSFGFYTFSRISLNSRQDQALIFRGYEYYDYCYNGLIYFEIVDGQWKVVDEEQLVIC